MNDSNKYKKIYYIIISSLVYFAVYYTLKPEGSPVIYKGYGIFTTGFGILLLLVSTFLKRFKLLGVISLFSIIGCSIIYLYSGSLYFSGYFLYSLSFSVFSADAFYAVSGKFNKFLIFIIPLSVFLLLIFVFDTIIANNYIVYSKSKNNKVQSGNNTQIEKTPLKEDTGSAVKKFSDPLKSDQTENNLTVDSLIKNKWKGDIKFEVTNMIYSWKYAWESKNINSVKSYLSSDYIYVGKDNKELSLGERTKRMQKTFKDYKYIRIELRDITFTIEDDYPNDITAEFYMTYKSDVYSDQGLKTLKIYKGKSTNNKWKIYKEYFEYYNPPREYQEYIPESTKPNFIEILKSILKWGGIIVLIIIVIAFIKKIFN